MKLKNIDRDYFRNAVFGAEDSLVSTVGILFGISTAIQNKTTILVTGLVLIAVSGLSMGAGAFLSETSAHKLKKGRKHKDVPLISGLIMLLSFFIAGLVPLTPYLLFEVTTGRYVSIGAALVSLFFLGMVPTKSIKDGIRMVTIAGLAILVGFLVGSYFS